MIYLGLVVDNQDPQQAGSCKILCPGYFGDRSISTWVPTICMAGSLFVPRIGDTVLVAAFEALEETHLFILGVRQNTPAGQGSLAPGASDLDPKEQVRTRILELNPDLKEVFTVKVKNSPVSITIDSESNQITLDPGTDSVQLGFLPMLKLAMQFDDVQVFSPTDGWLEGFISNGSAPAKARWVT